MTQRFASWMLDEEVPGSFPGRTILKVGLGVLGLCPGVNSVALTSLRPSNRCGFEPGPHL